MVYKGADGASWAFADWIDAHDIQPHIRGSCFPAVDLSSLAHISWDYEKPTWYAQFNALCSPACKCTVFGSGNGTGGKQVGQCRMMPTALNHITSQYILPLELDETWRSRTDKECLFFFAGSRLARVWYYPACEYEASGKWKKTTNTWWLEGD